MHVSTSENLGQTLPLSNFVPEWNSSAPHAAQWYVPLRSSASSGLLPGRSVPCSNMTEYSSVLSCSRKRSGSVCLSSWSFMPEYYAHSCQQSVGGRSGSNCGRIIRSSQREKTIRIKLPYL